MDELISKRAVIEAIEKARANVGHNLERSIGKSIIEILDEVGEDVEKLPPALGTNLAEVGTDCISRQQAIDIAKDLTITVEGYEMHNQAVMNYCADIMQLPPIQPKRGRWHYSDGKPARIGLSFGVVCDQCGTESEYCTNFCGECGADMRQREE